MISATKSSNLKTVKVNKKHTYQGLAAVGRTTYLMFQPSSAHLLDVHHHPDIATEANIQELLGTDPAAEIDDIITYTPAHTFGTSYAQWRLIDININMYFLNSSLTLDGLIESWSLPTVDENFFDHQTPMSMRMEQLQELYLLKDVINNPDYSANAVKGHEGFNIKLNQYKASKFQPIPYGIVDDNAPSYYPNKRMYDAFFDNSYMFKVVKLTNMTYPLTYIIEWDLKYECVPSHNTDKNIFSN